ncbi:hypothetical protein ACL9SP_17355 [Priestia flexa]|uniref:hypothetical protein n=1 Tax=Priestia flexa TaxID=86664 RepID=UPI002891183C|nr:hypothetical protein [Priestia flexa]MDT2048438.1 hypothetical protein [Priestia flexa]
MTPNTLRSFAMGLLVAATATGIVYLLEPSSTSTSKELSEEEMQIQLEDKGFVVQTQDELDKQLADAQAEAAQEAQKESKEEKEEQSKEEPVYRTIINVSSGMTAVDVGEVLEKAKIVKSGFEFYKKVEGQGVENKLRPGTFEVDSGMTEDEMIAVIFKG